LPYAIGRFIATVMIDDLSRSRRESDRRFVKGEALSAQSRLVFNNAFL
jgi:hypothetical protein